MKRSFEKIAGFGGGGIIESVRSKSHGKAGTLMLAIGFSIVPRIATYFETALRLSWRFLSETAYVHLRPGSSLEDAAY